MFCLLHKSLLPLLCACFLACARPESSVRPLKCLESAHPLEIIDSLDSLDSLDSPSSVDSLDSPVSVVSVAPPDSPDSVVSVAPPHSPASLASPEITSFFSVSAITDSLWSIMDGVSYHPDSPVGREDLRYLKILHRDALGRTLQGELVCHKRIAPALLHIFRRLYEAGYPIERVRLIDNYGGDDESSMAHNNTSCYNSRAVTGGRRLSRHAYGMAIDINPLYNPYVKISAGTIKKVAPEGATPYVDRNLDHVYMIKPHDLCHQQFLSAGFVWGGSWRTVKDYQHFEMK